MSYAHTVGPELSQRADADMMLIPRASEPSQAERSKTLVHSNSEGFLATIAHRPEGYPFGSIVRYALSEDGTPILCLSDLAEHTKNAVRDPKASLMVAERAETGSDPLANGRVTLVGDLAKFEAASRAKARDLYSSAFPDAYYIDFDDFGFYRLEVEAVRYVGGFGLMSWIKKDSYLSAKPDPLRSDAQDIIEHMNQDHGEALMTMASAFTDVPDTSAGTMTAVDRYGFDVTLDTPSGKRSERIRFTKDVTTPEGCRVEMIALLHSARKKLGLPAGTKH